MRLRIADMRNQFTPEYLSLADLAIYASVGKNALKKWLEDGMPYYKVNRCLRVRVDEFKVVYVKFCKLVWRMGL